MPAGVSNEKLFSFGIIADVQHANVDDGYNHHRTRMRYYRHALVKFEQAIDTWNERNVDFAVQLGDVIDGFSKKHGQRDNDLKNITNVMKKFESTGLPVVKQGNVFLRCGDNEGSGEESSGDEAFKCEDVKKEPYICHLWGNHEFYNYSRSELWSSALNSYVMNPTTTAKTAAGGSVNEIFPPTNEELDNTHGYYYSFCYKGFRFIALDTYEIGEISRPKGTEIHEASVKILSNRKKSPNSSNSHLRNWNGGLSNDQLTWLRNELALAMAGGEKVIILSHIPLHPDASRPASVCWNYEEILSVVNAHSRCIVACFAGHYHEGGFYHDMKRGIYYFTFQAALERDPATNAYAIAHVYADGIEVKGYGKIEARFLRCSCK